MRFILALLVLVTLSPSQAWAAQRSFSVGSFERVRIEGPFEVRIATGGSPGARAEGDQAQLDRLEIAVNGTTLTVRMGSGGWGETPATASEAPPVVMLSTPRLTALAIVSGARVTAGNMRGQRVDLTVTGAGSVAAEIESDQFAATLIGTGTAALRGKAARARLTVNGPGAIDAGALVTNDLIARLEGTGEISANARFTAQVTSTGVGKVTVSGDAKCIVRAVAGGPVACGAKRPD